jgi:hypothetical protein
MTANLEDLLKNTEYQEKYIGERIKQTKISYIWKFDYEYTTYTVELHCSKLSGKFRLYLNKDLLKEIVDLFQPFSHQFDINTLKCVVIQYGSKFDFRIDNQSFNHIYELQKNKNAFSKAKNEINKQDIKEQPNTNINKNLNYNQITGKYYEKEKPVENKESEFKFNIKQNTTNNNSKLKNFVFSNKNKDAQDSKETNIKEEPKSVDNIFEFTETSKNDLKENKNNNDLLNNQFGSNINQPQTSLDDIFSSMTIQDPKETKNINNSNEIIDIFQDLKFN